MARATNKPASRRRRKRVLKRAEGYYGRKRTSIRAAHDATMRADAYAFRHRREKKREYRSLWIARISAAVRPLGLTYSRFMNALRVGNVKLNRKTLSELAIHHKAQFGSLVEQAKSYLSHP